MTELRALGREGRADALADLDRRPGVEMVGSTRLKAGTAQKLVLNEETRKTLPVVIQSFAGRGDTDWGAIMAASVIYTLRVVAVFIVLRKHLMRGTTAGAVKG